MNMFDTAQPQAGYTANQPEEITTAPESQDGESSAAENESLIGSAAGDKEPFMTIRYNKEHKPLSKEEAIAYAQKGMNYDKLQERLKSASEKLSEYEKGVYEQHGSQEAKEEKQAVIDAQLDAFLRGNPGIDPRKLPESVMDAWKKGVPLNEAFLNHQSQELYLKVREMEKAARQADVNRMNEAASMGSAVSSGPTRGKALSDENIRSMTAVELEKNHDRIWAYLTGK